LQNPKSEIQNPKSPETPAVPETYYRGEPMTRLGGLESNADDPDDSLLVLRTLAGDREAFEILIRRYQRLVFRIVGGFLRDRADVEEVAQEAFLRAFEGLRGFRPGAPFGPWVARIATFASYDRLRRRGRTPEVAWGDLSSAEQDAIRGLVAGADPADRAAVRDLLDRAMACLPPKDRQVLVLADGMGFSGAQVAQALGCSSLAARIRLHRARRAMRGVIEALLAGMERTGSGPKSPHLPFHQIPPPPPFRKGGDGGI
jgi:RNA polymerase sigma-70 factor (ECF subfamily)